MKIKSIRSIAVLLCLSLCWAASGQTRVATAPGNPEIRQILIDRIDTYKKSVGMVVGVLTPQGTRVVAYGAFDAQDKRVPSADSVYEIGSISKVFTSTLLMDMVEHGEVKLDDPVSKYLPETVHMPSRHGKQITLLDLAMHVSGLPRMPTNFAPKDVANPYVDYTVQQMYDFLSNYQLTRDIGEKYEYSNLAVGLLGHALARRAGTDYETLLRTRILRPLGMNSTGVALTPDMQRRLAPGHTETLQRTSNWDIVTLAGAGGIRSTVNDLFKFLAANMGLRPSPLHPAMKAMLSQRRASAKENVDVAIAWHIINRYGDDIVWHNGGTGGYHTFMGFDPKKQLGIIVLSNASNDIDDIGRHLIDPRYELAKLGPPPDLDAYVSRVMKEFEVPGVAVGIVKDGQVLVTKGYGVRELGKADPVDEHTLFGIASNTKAFTAAALATLVDEGKISWDDPVSKHLPWFQLYDPYATRELTIRDLLSHRSGLGLGGGDLLFWPHTSYTRDEILHRMRFVKPASSFRSHYAYDNMLYLAAGQIIPAVTGKSWDDFIQERIFKPVGMTSSNTSVGAFHPGDNFVSPHARVNGHLTPIPWMNIDNTAPAGGINSSAADMSKWVLLQLNRGRLPNDDRVFSERQSAEMWTAQTIMPIVEPPQALAALRPNFAAYGLGWALADYRGRKIVNHTGGLEGLVSKVQFVPAENLGIVVLTNQEETGAFHAIVYHIIDYYLNVPPTDWSSAFHQQRERQLEAAALAETEQSSTRVEGSKPSLPIEKYAGNYNDDWYGGATITYEDGKLVLHFDHTPLMVGEMEYWQYDTFKVHWRDRSLALADAFVSFVLKPDGAIEQMKMAAISPLCDFSFDYQDLVFKPESGKK